jgi:Pentapeptide repeats (8 copies)
MNSIDSNYDLLRQYVSGQRNFDGVNFNLINLDNAIIREANFLESNFNLANLQHINLSNSCLDRSYLIRCNLENANLKRTSFQNACLIGANLKQACLEESNLQSADLKGVNLQKAYLHKAYFDRADLRKANLQQACLEGAFLEGAYYNETTKFDRDFNPVAAGMVLVEKKQGNTPENLSKATEILSKHSDTNVEADREQHISWNFLKEEVFKDSQTIKTMFQKYQGRYYLINKIGKLLTDKKAYFERNTHNRSEN